MSKAALLSRENSRYLFSTAGADYYEMSCKFYMVMGDEAIEVSEHEENIQKFY